jgi:hypothetical protein
MTTMRANVSMTKRCVDLGLSFNLRADATEAWLDIPMFKGSKLGTRVVMSLEEAQLLYDRLEDIL